MENRTPRFANTLAKRERITGISLVNGEVTLTWNAIPGRTYRVEFKNALSDPSWTAMLPDVVAAGESASVTDNVGGGIPNRFYRVHRLD
jgi:hypothetical protein